jgi:hypothetical protein
LQQRIITMWSGPRNISTALLRSWGNRADTAVIDEPFYAHYLDHTGYDHPVAEKIIASYPTDWRDVVKQVTGEIPNNKAIFYQKQMTHHILDHIDKSWMTQVINCFLIRDPRRMILSFMKVIPNPELHQLGVQQQVEIFNYVCDVTGKIPPVISARDVLLNPRKILTKLCEAIDVPFDEAMLEWEAGKQETDGVWAEHWYGSVEKSTTFMAYKEDETPVPKHLESLLDECQDLYDQMAQYCIK